MNSLVKIGCLAVTMGLSSPAVAGDSLFFGGLTLKSAYINTDHGGVNYDDAVLQGYVGVNIPDTPCALSVWTSVGVGDDIVYSSDSSSEVIPTLACSGRYAGLHMSSGVAASWVPGEGLEPGFGFAFLKLIGPDVADWHSVSIKPHAKATYFASDTSGDSGLTVVTGVYVDHEQWRLNLYGYSSSAFGRKADAVEANVTLTRNWDHGFSTTVGWHGIGGEGNRALVSVTKSF